MKVPGKKYKNDFKLQKEDSYKMDFAKVNNPPIEYLSRIYKATGGKSLTYHPHIDPQT